MYPKGRVISKFKPQEVAQQFKQVSSKTDKCYIYKFCREVICLYFRGWPMKTLLTRKSVTSLPCECGTLKEMKT